MSNQSTNDGFEKVKNVLGSGPDQGWVFGVCANLARRTGWDLWAVRAVMLVALLIMSLLTVLSYFVMAMLMNETRPGAQRRMRRWAGQLDTVFDTVSAGVKRFFADKNPPRDYSQDWREDTRA
ncbi:MAG: PspC domain-containing protein [Lysobacterales bacterium]